MATIKYRYDARSKKGELLSGTIEAESEDKVLEYLSSHGYYPIEIKETQEGDYLTKLVSFIMGWHKKITDDDLILFTRQLSTLIKAGLPLLTNIDTMTKQVNSAYFKKVLKDIYDDVKGGSSFSNALSQHKDIFSEIYVHLVKAGEIGGLLEEVMFRLADLLEHEREVKQKVNSATRYPKLVLIAITIAFIVVITFVLPKFIAVFARFGTDLPLPTKILIWANNFIKGYWYIGVAFVLGIFYSFKIYKSLEHGRLALDRLKLKLPVFGNLFTKVAMSRFARTLAALTRAGIPILTSLEISADTTGNLFITKTMGQIIDSVDKGASIAGAMNDIDYFPPIVKQMITIGEETGQLDTMLDKVSEYYDSDVNYNIKNLSTLIEPFLILFLGIMVLILALGIFLPMWNMMSLFR